MAFSVVRSEQSRREVRLYRAEPEVMPSALAAASARADAAAASGRRRPEQRGRAAEDRKTTAAAVDAMERIRCRAAAAASAAAAPAGRGATCDERRDGSDVGVAEQAIRPAERAQREQPQRVHARRGLQRGACANGSGLCGGLPRRCGQAQQRCRKARSCGKHARTRTRARLQPSVAWRRGADECDDACTRLCERVRAWR